jgi:predicted Ser/Thr protein kinase
LAEATLVGDLRVTHPSGEVYRARWNGMDVAAKMLNPKRQQDLEEFEKEAAVLQQLAVHKVNT